MNASEIARLLGEHRVISENPFIAEYLFGPITIRLLIIVGKTTVEALEYAEKLVRDGRADKAIIVVEEGESIKVQKLYPHVVIIPYSSLKRKGGEIIRGLMKLDVPVRAFKPICNKISASTTGVVLDFLYPLYIVSFSITIRKYFSSDVVTGVIAVDAVTGAPILHSGNVMKPLRELANIDYDEGLVLDTLQKPMTEEALRKTLLVDVRATLKKLLEKKLVKPVGGKRKTLYKAVVPGPRTIARRSIWPHLKTIAYKPSDTYTLQIRVSEKDVINLLKKLYGRDTESNIALVYYPFFIILESGEIKVFDRVRCREATAMKRLLEKMGGVA